MCSALRQWLAVQMAYSSTLTRGQCPTDWHSSATAERQSLRAWLLYLSPYLSVSCNSVIHKKPYKTYHHHHHQRKREKVWYLSKIICFISAKEWSMTEAEVTPHIKLTPHKFVAAPACTQYKSSPTQREREGGVNSTKPVRRFSVDNSAGSEGVSTCTLTCKTFDL